MYHKNHRKLYHFSLSSDDNIQLTILTITFEKKEEENCHHFDLYISNPVVGESVSSVPLGKSKIEWQWPRSAVEKVVPLDWFAKEARVWWRVVFVNLCHQQCVRLCAQFRLPKEGIYRLRRGPKLWWHFSGQQLRMSLRPSVKAHCTALVWG